LTTDVLALAIEAFREGRGIAGLFAFQALAIRDRQVQPTAERTFEEAKRGDELDRKTAVIPKH